MFFKKKKELFDELKDDLKKIIRSNLEINYMIL
jgi:hypothetical protein